MAKYEKTFRADFDEFTEYLEYEILHGSMSASLEEESEYKIDNVRCKMMTFERYSYFGQNRVSMNVVILGCDGEIVVNGTTSGGSQAVFLKINTFGESDFLDTLVTPVEKYIKNH